MEKPRFKPETPSSSSIVEVLSQSSSGRRSSASNSPEFEFWMVRNPPFPQPQLLSADELFIDGVLQPLQFLPHHSDPPDPEEQKPDTEIPIPKSEPEPEPEPGPGPQSSAALSESSTGFSSSKRWRDIFKIGEKKTTATTSSTAAETKEKDREKDREKDKEKKKERKSGGASGSGTELNINIWPFSRSRSAGNGGNRPKLPAAATRKVSSAPCSRSNSGGESKSRKWPSSPGRGGVHLGRSSPVWQVRRGGSVVRSSDRTGPSMLRNGDKGGKKEAMETSGNKNNGGGSGSRALNLTVPMCIGYRHHLSCRSENSIIGGGGSSSSCSSSKRTGGGGGGGSSGAGAGNGGSGRMNLRTIFSKKVY